MSDRRKMGQTKSYPPLYHSAPSLSAFWPEFLPIPSNKKVAAKRQPAWHLAALRWVLWWRAISAGQPCHFASTAQGHFWRSAGAAASSGNERPGGHRPLGFWRPQVSGTRTLTKVRPPVTAKWSVCRAPGRIAASRAMIDDKARWLPRRAAVIIGRPRSWLGGGGTSVRLGFWGKNDAVIFYKLFVICCGLLDKKRLALPVH